jgi:hypothetical protein
MACKKGEDDPAFSLRTRKARVEGKWRLLEGEVIKTLVDFKSFERVNYSYILKPSKFEVTFSGPNNLPYYATGFYSLNVECSKSGQFILKERAGSYVFEAEGTWDFNAKSGNKKSKEYVNMSVKHTTKGTTSGVLFSQESVNFNYHIKKLRNKRMVLEAQGDLYVDAINELEISFKGYYVLIHD